MKLKDILKTDTDNTGWLKTFKKLGADREILQYVNNNISKEGGGSSEIKYYEVDGLTVRLADYVNLTGIVGILSRAIKFKLNNQSKTINTSSYCYNEILNDSEGIIYAFSACPIILEGIEINSLEDILALGVVPEVELKEITKEEFYTL